MPIHRPHPRTPPTPPTTHNHGGLATRPLSANRSPTLTTPLTTHAIPLQPRRATASTPSDYPPLHAKPLPASPTIRGTSNRQTAITAPLFHASSSRSLMSQQMVSYGLVTLPLFCRWSRLPKPCGTKVELVLK